MWDAFEKFDGEQPGSEGFQPTAEWLSKKLRVQVISCTAIELEESGDKGENSQFSGHAFAHVNKPIKCFKCVVKYGGSLTNPSLGLPTELFVKCRMPGKDPDVFIPDMVVASLARNLARPPPMSRTLWIGPEAVIVENIKDQMTARDWGSDKSSAKDLRLILDSYAALHAAFWGLPAQKGVHSTAEWSHIFSGECFGKEKLDEALDKFSWRDPVWFRKARDDIGFEKIITHLNSHGTTLIHGDTFNGNITKDGRWRLIDFEHAAVCNPAMDVGALLLQLADEDEEEAGNLMVGYWQTLTTLLKANGVEPNMDLNQFQCDCEFGIAFRSAFLCAILHTSEPGAFPEAFKNGFKNFLREAEIFREDMYERIASEISKA